MVSVVEKIILNKPANGSRRIFAPQIQNHLALRRERAFCLGYGRCYWKVGAYRALASGNFGFRSTIIRSVFLVPRITRFEPPGPAGDTDEILVCVNS
jgi:hypothetical protein